MGGVAMRLTIRTNLAMRVLMHCAVNMDRKVRKTDIATACNASENHLAQVIHALGQKGFVITMRGRGGGLQLARAPEEISVGALFRAMESGVPLTECFSDVENKCPLSGVCRLHCVLQEAIEAFYQRLDQISLADLVRDNKPLEAILRAA